jgi:hypothetical protein
MMTGEAMLFLFAVIMAALLLFMMVFFVSFFYSILYSSREEWIKNYITLTFCILGHHVLWFRMWLHQPYWSL